MIWLSELLMQHHEVGSFGELLDVVAAKARDGERFMRIDVKPPFADTPDNWEDRVEAVFTAVLDSRHGPQ